MTISRRFSAAVLAAILSLAALTACESEHDRMTKQCADDKGTVTSEREYDRKLKRTVTEYECERDGVELYEW